MSRRRSRWRIGTRKLRKALATFDRQILPGLLVESAAMMADASMPGSGQVIRSTARAAKSAKDLRREAKKMAQAELNARGVDALNKHNLNSLKDREGMIELAASKLGSRDRRTIADGVRKLRELGLTATQINERMKYEREG